MPATRMTSILAVDFGSVNTRALLFDLVEGEYRLVGQGKARSTIASPHDDAQLALTQILQQMEQETGRQFLDESGGVIRPEQKDRIGVDYFLTTTSAGAPPRALLVGLYPQASIASARRAIAPFYIDAVATIHLEDGLGDRGRLNRIVHSRPQLVLVTGGTDGGARNALLEMLSLLRQAISLLPTGDRPTVLYAGNNSLAPSVREMLSQQVEVVIAPNIRQQDGESLTALQAVLGRYFDEYKRHRGTSFQRIGLMTDSGILPTARGIETMTSFFSRSSKGAVLTIDFGSAHTMLSLANKGKIATAIRNDIGIGHSAASALERLGPEAVKAWLPFHPRREELAQYALNKGLRSASVPLNMRQRYIEYALLRGGLQFMLAQLPQENALAKLGMVLLAGATITSSAQGALDMMLIADALQATGIIQVKADPYSALPALGALASVEPTAVIQLLGNNVIEHVGTLIRLSGSVPAGATALKVKIKRSTGETSEREIPAGDLWHLPVPGNSQVELRIQARRGLSIGGKRKLRLKLAGGRGGILFDARLDALDSQTSMTTRAVNMLRWFAAVTGQEDPVVIPESWLAPPDDTV